MFALGCADDAGDLLVTPREPREAPLQVAEVRPIRSIIAGMSSNSETAGRVRLSCEGDHPQDRGQRENEARKFAGPIATGGRPAAKIIVSTMP